MDGIIVTTGIFAAGAFIAGVVVGFWHGCDRAERRNWRNWFREAK